MVNVVKGPNLEWIYGIASQTSEESAIFHKVSLWAIGNWKVEDGVSFTHAFASFLYWKNKHWAPTGMSQAQEFRNEQNR